MRVPVPRRGSPALSRRRRRFGRLPIARIEMANGLVMMHGRKMVDEAGKLYSEAAGIDPRDAMEKLDVDAAREELA